MTRLKDIKKNWNHMYVWIQDIIIENGYLWYKSSCCAYIEGKLF